MVKKTSPATKDAAENQNEDKTPEADESLLDAPVDDAAEPGEGDEPAPRVAKKTDDGEGEEPAPRPKPVGDEGRDEIARKWREKRKADIAAAEAAKAGHESGDDGAGDEPADGDGGEGEASSEGDDPPVTAKPKAKEAQADDAGDAETVAMVVDGQVVRKTRKEVQQLAQAMLHSDSRLDDTKKLLEEVRALHNRPAEGEPDPKAVKKDEPVTPAAKKSALDLDELADVVDKIQLGDKEEGAKALQGIIEKIAAASQPQQVEVPDVAAVVKQTLQSDRRSAEVADALASFSQAYPDVAKDDMLGTTAQMLVQRELVKDLKDAGFTDADLKPILAKPVAEATVELSARQFQMREQGVKMRPFKEVMAAVGTTLTEKYGFKPAAGVRQQPGSGKSQLRQEPTAKRLPVDPGQQQARLDQKRQQTTQQPRAAGVRGAITPQKQPKSRADVVRDIIKQRGFQPTR